MVYPAAWREGVAQPWGGAADLRRSWVRGVAQPLRLRGARTRHPLARAVELVGAGLEGADHAAHRLVEETFDDLLQQLGAELEVDVEVDEATLRVVLEDPVVLEVLEGPFGVGDVDAAAGRIGFHAAGEA